MNTKVNIRFNLKMVEYFNEQLAIENSVTERLVTRIHEVSFPNFKQRLEKNLRETMGRKEMIYQLIVSLGGKPTDTKSTLPTLKMPDSHSIRELKDSVESFTNHRRKEAKLAEEEIHKIKEDKNVNYKSIPMSYLQFIAIVSKYSTTQVMLNVPTSGRIDLLEIKYSLQIEFSAL